MGLNHSVDQGLLNVNTQYQRLNTMHDALEKQIKAEQAHPLADMLRLKTLKRKKLLVADEMFKLSKR